MLGLIDRIPSELFNQGPLRRNRIGMDDLLASPGAASTKPFFVPSIPFHLINCGCPQLMCFANVGRVEGTQAELGVLILIPKLSIGTSCKVTSNTNNNYKLKINHGLVQPVYHANK